MFSKKTFTLIFIGDDMHAKNPVAKIASTNISPNPIKEGSTILTKRHIELNKNATATKKETIVFFILFLFVFVIVSNIEYYLSLRFPSGQLMCAH